jgi:hypothetical protein
MNQDRKQPQTNSTTNNSTLSHSQLSQERATKSNSIEIPSISLPKGGGAIKGIDEKFLTLPTTVKMENKVWMVVRFILKP